LKAAHRSTRSIALYVLLLVSPLLGWAGANPYSDPVSIFGLFTFPSIAVKDVPLSDRIFVWHLVCGILVAAIVALHVAGANTTARWREFGAG
jgi:cytochrome b561